MCVVRYGGQQDASTNKVSIRSTNQKCHTTLSDNYISQPKVNESQRCPSQWETQNNNKKSTQPSQSQRPAFIFVPINADCKNRNSGTDLGQFDHVLTKVNASQLFTENPRLKT